MVVLLDRSRCLISLAELEKLSLLAKIRKKLRCFLGITEEFIAGFHLVGCIYGLGDEIVVLRGPFSVESDIDILNYGHPRSLCEIPVTLQ